MGLRGFGSLEAKDRKAYKARNHKTGDPLIAPVGAGYCSVLGFRQVPIMTL
jgi:hypothetical protein